MRRAACCIRLIGLKRFLKNRLSPQGLLKKSNATTSYAHSRTRVGELKDHMVRQMSSVLIPALSARAWSSSEYNGPGTRKKISCCLVQSLLNSAIYRSRNV